MPIYEYICRECDHSFEAIITGSAKAKCPACSSGRLDQQYSGFAVGAVKGRGQFGKSAKSGGGCGSCGDPRDPGSCSSH